MDELMKEFSEVLNEYGHGNSDEGITKILKNWKENKSILINILSKHPNWVKDKYMIQFDTDVEREIDTSKVINFFRNLNNIKKVPYDICDYFYKYTEKTVGSYRADFINNKYPELKVRPEQKTTKVVRKILEYLNYPELCGIYINSRDEEKSRFEKWYADYADAMSPLTVKRHTVISVNPIDYLLSSNGNSWSSCHTINPESDEYSGCHRSGTLSYMMDPSTMVFYQVDSKYSGDNIELEPKIIRQLFHYESGVLIQGRLYPQCNDGKNSLYTPLRAIMQKVLADCLDLPNLWKKKGGTKVCKDFIIINESYAHYPDYLYNDECNVSRILDLCPEGKDTRKVNIGHIPYCINCGKRINEGNTLYCDNSACYERDGDLIVCHNCGYLIADEEDAYYVNDIPYCCDCVSYCDDCESYHVNEDVRYLENYDRYVCDECLERDYDYCDYCDEYYLNEEITETEDGNRVCNSCLEYYYTEIDGKYYNNKVVKECPQCGELFVGEGEFCCEECKGEGEENDSV